MKRGAVCLQRNVVTEAGLPIEAVEAAPRPLLDQVCAGDPNLRREVEALLAAADLQAQRANETKIAGANFEQVETSITGPRVVPCGNQRFP